MTALTFAQALTQAEAQARSTLPVELHERLSCAVALVKEGRVFQTTTGDWQVDSSGTEGLTYTVNGHCSCKDHHYNHPPHGLCKHRLGMFLAQRVQTLLAKPPAPVVPEGLPVVPPVVEPWPENDPEDAPESPAVPLPEAPVSITLKASLDGHEVLVTLRGHDFASVKAQVEEASDWLKAHAPALPAVPAEGWCGLHRLQMRWNAGKEGKHGWWSHKTADDKWCQGKGR